MARPWAKFVRLDVTAANRRHETPTDADAPADASLTCGFAVSGSIKSNEVERPTAVFDVRGGRYDRGKRSSPLPLDRTDDDWSKSVENKSIVTERTRGAGPLGSELVALSTQLSRCQYQLVVAAAAFAESPEWILDGSPTPAHWLAAVADVEECTAREWIRIGKSLADLPEIGAAFESRRLSYSKVRALTRVATAETEAELVELVADVPAAEVGKTIAAWLHRNLPPEDIAARQRAARGVKWRTEPDGMVVFTLRLQPHIAAVLISVLTMLVMRAKNRSEPDGTYPSTVAQYADAVEALLDTGTGTVDTEVIFHVRGDGTTTDDGTPICDTIIAELVPAAFIRVLIHDADSRPINASGRQRHPTSRQRRVVKERDRSCVDCGRHDLLEYDHVPAYEVTRHTVVDELQLRCAPCHHRRHHPPTA